MGDLDRDFHNGDTDSSIIRAASDHGFIKDMNDQDAGRHCWLLYSVFDILLVDGPDATKLFQDCNLGHVTPGSIHQLSCLERKQILHGLLIEQKNKVEICQSIVIRPTGESMPGEKYFDPTNPVMEYGYPVTLLDSTKAAIQGSISNLEDIDRRRQGNSSMLVIDQKRARVVESFYQQVVESNKMEGILLKVSDVYAPIKVFDYYNAY